MPIENLKAAIANRTLPISPLKEHREPMLAILAGDLKEAIAKNPEHPVAKVYAKAILFAAPSRQISVDLTDLQALLDNKSVVVEEKLEKQVDLAGNEQLVIVCTKKLVPLVKESAPAPVPSPPAK